MTLYVDRRYPLEVCKVTCLSIKAVIFCHVNIISWSCLSFIMFPRDLNRLISLSLSWSLLKKKNILRWTKEIWFIFYMQKLLTIKHLNQPKLFASPEVLVFFNYHLVKWGWIEKFEPSNLFLNKIDKSSQRYPLASCSSPKCSFSFLKAVNFFLHVSHW